MINSKNQDKGFTLVELLIVIVILGILATVTVFAVRGITDTGQQNACAVEARTLDTAIEAHYAQTQLNAVAVGDLTPAYLKDAPDILKFTFTAGTNPAVGVGAAASFTAIGVCA
jgi:prepilin-type N-terminal cleavage/methylation domain-containing protein